MTWEPTYLPIRGAVSPGSIEPVLGLTHGGYTDTSRVDTLGGYIDGYKSRVDANGALSCKIFSGRPDRPAEILQY